MHLSPIMQGVYKKKTWSNLICFISKKSNGIDRYLNYATSILSIYVNPLMHLDTRKLSYKAENIFIAN